jgi:hypothetical protein
MNQLIAILVMAPDALRARYRRLYGDRLAIALARSRGASDPVAADTLLALEALPDLYRRQPPTDPRLRGPSDSERPQQT